VEDNLLSEDGGLWISGPLARAHGHRSKSITATRVPDLLVCIRNFLASGPRRLARRLMFVAVSGRHPWSVSAAMSTAFLKPSLKGCGVPGAAVEGSPIRPWPLVPGKAEAPLSRYCSAGLLFYLGERGRLAGGEYSLLFAGMAMVAHLARMLWPACMRAGREETFHRGRCCQAIRSGPFASAAAVVSPPAGGHLRSGWITAAGAWNKVARPVTRRRGSMGCASKARIVCC